jgi:transcriptional repressor NrdR
LRCPKCHVADTKVLESRLSADGSLVRRRRACLECPHRFTTYEKAEELAFQVQKKDGRFEPYDRDKALRSIRVACQKRPITIDEIENLLNAVEKSIQDEGERTVISRRLGDLIMEGLRKLDHVAYVRFASVYKEFHTPEEFVAELKSLKGP